MGFSFCSFIERCLLFVKINPIFLTLGKSKLYDQLICFTMLEKKFACGDKEDSQLEKAGNKLL